MNKFKFRFLGTLLLLVVTVGCSNDDSVDNTNADTKNGIITNEDMTLTYGSELLNEYVSLKNSPITFTNFSQSSKSGKSTASTNALAAVSSYQPDITGAIALTGNGSVSINTSDKFYIAENTTFTGGINFNGAGTLIILGKLGSSNAVNVPNGGLVEVGSTGEIMSSANFNLNGDSTLNNYGKVTYASETVSGTINNYNAFVFSKAVSLNGSSVVNNNCNMVFDGLATLNASFSNNAYSNFKAGFFINGSGKLILSEASLTDVSGGTIGIDGKVENTSNGFSRLDITNATFGNMNANPAFIGKIDINTTLTISSGKINSAVVLNANTFIAADGCTPQRGINACDDSVLEFTLTATVESPTVNGAILSATDVKVVNGKAYVSYHTNDEVYNDAPNGSVRIFNVQNQQNPVLSAQADFNNAEFNGIDVNNNMVYAVGGNKAGARLITAPIEAGVFTTNDLSVFKVSKLPSITAKNSFLYNGKLWLVSGASNGGLFTLNPADNYTISNQFNNDGAKYVAHNGTHQAFFAVEATGAYLRIADIDGANPKDYRFTALAQTVKDGKNVITMDDNYVYVALSDKGVAKVSLETGEMIHHFIPNDYMKNGAKVFKFNGYTNGVAVNDCYLYLANGADGVIVLNKNTFNVVGSFTLGESANFVYAQNGLLFVATGRNGLNIIKVN